MYPFTNKHRIITHLTIWLSVIFLTFSSLYALPLQSNNAKLQVLPTPGKIVLDGNLDDWDLSGEMYVYRSRDIRERYSAKVYAMWDKESFYLALHFKDPTPLYNNVDPVGSPGNGWMADCFQARFITDYPQIHMTAWYSSKFDMSAFTLEYDTPGNAVGAVIERAKGQLMKVGSGIEMAFKKDPDNRGYVQEIKIPWKVLYKKVPDNLPGNLQFGFTGEYYWGGSLGDKWPHALYVDPVNPENPIRVVIYQNPSAWGKAELLDKGHLPPKQDEGEFDIKLQGTIPIHFEVPSDASNITVVIEDEEGRRVRNLLNNAKIEPYVVGKKGDKVMLEVLWDGRMNGDFDKERSLFVGDVAPAGKYKARVVSSSGIGVTYAGSFYNPGTPPWPTADKKGGWGFDHSNPTAVGAMPKDSDGAARVFLGWAMGEGGMGFLGLNEAGRKIWHWYRQGIGGEFYATTPKQVYFIFKEGSTIGRVNPHDGEQVPFSNGQLDIILDAKANGLAVNEKEIAVSLGEKNKIVFYDSQSSAKLREVEIISPGSLAFSPEGILVGVSANKELFLLKPGGKPEIFALKEVIKPQALALDSKGQLYVTDTDATQQNVKLYDKAGPGGKLIRKIGEPGGHTPGPWTPNRMNNPSSIAIEERKDGSTQVWVVENSTLPRRFSVWSPEGKFIKDYLGNTSYSGSGGALSDNIPSLGLMNTFKSGTMLFDVDSKTHTYRLTNIVGPQDSTQPAGKHRLFKSGMGIGDFGNPNHFITSASGKKHEYIVEGNGSVSLLFMKQGENWIPKAALGNTIQGFKFPEGFPQPPSGDAVFSWADKNDDGFQTPDEITWWNPGRPVVLQPGWGGRCFHDLVWYTSGFAFKPEGFTPSGAPLYDVSKAKPLPGELANIRGDVFKTKFGYIANVDDDNNPNLFRMRIVGYDDKGIEKWRYPNWWMGVFGAFTAPVPGPGLIIGSLKFTGLFELNGHSILSIRGNMGQEFLIRDDGIFLSELFTDNRMVPSEWPAEENPTKLVGVPINEMTLREEPFSGSMARQDDDRVRMTFGEQDVRIAEVTGLNSVKDGKTQEITLTAEMVEKNKAFQPKRSGPEKTTTYKVSKGGPFTGEEKEFAGNDVIRIYAGREELGKALLRYDETNLYVAWQVFDETAMVNDGIDNAYSYKSGDSVSLFITDKDIKERNIIAGQRILLTQLKGQPLAMLYRPQGGVGKLFTFESPVRKTTFESVTEEPGIKFQTHPSPMFYIVTATIPWKTLGIEPKSGMSLRADVGLTFGRSDSIGYVSRRVQWVDDENMIVNDAPTEVEFFPGRWGTITLE